MPRVDVVVRSKTSQSARAAQLCGMFDVPPTKESVLKWTENIPIEEKPWSVGLVVGPSGCGKSTIARDLWGDLVDRPLDWSAPAVVDDFGAGYSMDEIAKVCQAVGFNTIPAWLRPFHVLSNGEQFRASLARRLLESDGLVVVDEFTSVVDRQVAAIGSHAVQKHIRRAGRQFVGVTCHYDVIDWLQPDWTFDPSSSVFEWRSVQPRPQIEVEIRRVSWSEWRRFAPFHYLTNSLHRAARCFVLYVNGNPAAFAGMIGRPTKGLHGEIAIMGCSRLVTLPDYQGVGLAFALIDKIAAAYKSAGLRARTYPAHPALIRAFDRSTKWAMTKKPGAHSRKSINKPGMGGRPCAVFEWAGGPDKDAATALGISYKGRTLRG